MSLKQTGMTKKEIIKLLDKEIGLAIIEEEENDNGDMYITFAELKTAERILNDLCKKRQKAKERRQYYIKRIKEIGTEKQVIFEKADNKVITNSDVNLNEKLYLVGDNMTISGNYINLKKEPGMVIE